MLGTQRKGEGGCLLGHLPQRCTHRWSLGCRAPRHRVWGGGEAQAVFPLPAVGCTRGGGPRWPQYGTSPPGIHGEKWGWKQWGCRALCREGIGSAWGAALGSGHTHASQCWRSSSSCPPPPGMEEQHPPQWAPEKTGRALGCSATHCNLLPPSCHPQCIRARWHGDFSPHHPPPLTPRPKALGSLRHINVYSSKIFFFPSFFFLFSFYTKFPPYACRWSLAAP